MPTIPTFIVEAVMPALDEARRLGIEEIPRAKREGIMHMHQLRRSVPPESFPQRDHVIRSSVPIQGRDQRTEKNGEV